MTPLLRSYIVTAVRQLLPADLQGLQGSDEIFAPGVRYKVLCLIANIANIRFLEDIEIRRVLFFSSSAYRPQSSLLHGSEDLVIAFVWGLYHHLRLMNRA